MPYLVDTNVLLRWSHPTDPSRPLVRAAVAALAQRGEELYVAPQNLFEFWNAATRPLDRNGFGLSIPQADAALSAIESFFLLAADSAAVYPEWRKLVQTIGVTGVKVHDARLAAHCRVHRITHILTLNVTDFQRYPRITPVHPSRLTPGIP